MRPILCLTALLLCCHAVHGAGFSSRAADFTEALEQAKASGNDIVVLQRGSDWNRLGETLFQKIWSVAEFPQQLGQGFVLVTVDRPERVGAAAIGSGEDPSGFERLLKVTGPEATLPPDEITAVHSGGSGVFGKRNDGAWLLDDPAREHNPPRDTLRLTLRTRSGGQLLRIDFLPDKSLANSGSGRAFNGNFALSEVEISSGLQPLKTSEVWANAAEGAMVAAQVIDGIKDKADNGWNPGAHTGQRRSLIIKLASPVRAGSELSVKLICNSQWPEHVPACFRAAMIDDAPLAKCLSRVIEAQRLEARNGKFSWWDGGRCPRVALLDSEGRAIAAIDSPRSNLTPVTLAEAIKNLRKLRVVRDELIAKAKNLAGVEKAEVLRQSLAVLGFANWAGNADCYRSIQDQIRQADPQDRSGATRWLGFSSDPKGGVPWAKPAWNEALDTGGGKRTLTDADFREALSRVDKELADPRNKILSHENLQRMMVAKYHICKSWKGHEEERFGIQEQIAQLDADTFWGIGARGYLGMHGKSATPFLTYGWKPGQVKAGLNSWRMSDTSYFLDHAGTYKITLTHTGGASKLKVKRLVVLDGQAVVAQAQPDAAVGPGAAVEVTLDLSAWKPGKAYVFLAELEAAAGQTDSSGRFSLEPMFIEPPASAANAGVDCFTKRRGLSDKLAKTFGQPAEIGKALAKESVQLELARHEVLRRCGSEALDRVAAKPGGQVFLRAFTNDAGWMESFLANDDCQWPQAIENLRFLHHNGGGYEKPLYRTLATALAMSAGEMNRYRLFSRYKDTIANHKEGLLHVSFDKLDVREMRWATLLSGTAADYRFMVDTIQVRMAEYLGACGQIPYIDPNVYGYSVQGWGYTEPWQHRYGTGTGDRPFRIQKTVGGVCGTLSGYGAATARAHGVMATTVGQPAHCAYVVRIGLEWPTGNDVSGPETNGASVYEGTGFPTMHRLYEPIHADKQAYLNASRLAWAAHLFLDRRSALVRIRPGMKYSVYALPGGRIDDIAKLKPTATGKASGFDLAAVKPADPNNFGVVWEGEIEVAGDGPLTVDVKSDDSSRLSIGGQTVAGNQGPVALHIGKGVHPVKLEYGQGGGALSLAVTWSSPAAWNKDWTGVYQQALAAQPIQYPLALETIKAFEAAADIPAGMWTQLIGELATAYAPYHEAGWALVNRCYAKVAPTLKPEERLALLLQCHESIKQANAPKFFGYNFAGVLNAQADSLGSPELAVTFLQKLLSIHYAADPAKSAQSPQPPQPPQNQNRVFGEVMNWGSSRFAQNKNTAAAYAKAIAAFFDAHGSSLDPNQMRGQISVGIRKASESGDVESFRLWTDMAARLLPVVQPGDVFLSAVQAAAWPKITAPAGSLLSNDGMLQTSSACEHDRPLSYRAILDGSAPGWFDTNGEEKPWAQITLAGEAEVSSVILVNRYEFQADQPEFQWAVPLKVLLSADGKTWSEAAVCEKADAVMQVGLAGKSQSCRYIRIERVPSADKSKPPGRFHFRNFLVYGRKLH